MVTALIMDEIISHTFGEISLRIVKERGRGLRFCDWVVFLIRLSKTAIKAFVMFCTMHGRI